MRGETLIAYTFLALSGIAFASSRQQATIENRTLDQIYQAALKESRPLTVAWGADRELASLICSLLNQKQYLPVKAFSNLIIDAFHNRFPDIKLNLTGDLSKYWDSKIDAAYQSKDNGVDVAVLQSLHDFPCWKTEGRLMPYKVASWNDIYPDYVDPDGTYTGLFVGKCFSLDMFIFIFNPLFKARLAMLSTTLTKPTREPSLVV